MKKFRIGLPALALAVAVAASAFTPTGVTPKTTDPMFHWFSPSNTYLGQRTEAAQEALCPGSGITCARGYDDKTANNQPIGPVKVEVEKQP